MDSRLDETMTDVDGGPVRETTPGGVLLLFYSSVTNPAVLNSIEIRLPCLYCLDGYNSINSDPWHIQLLDFLLAILLGNNHQDHHRGQRSFHIKTLGPHRKTVLSTDEERRP